MLIKVIRFYYSLYEATDGDFLRCVAVKRRDNREITLWEYTYENMQKRVDKYKKPYELIDELITYLHDEQDKGNEIIFENRPIL